MLWKIAFTDKIREYFGEKVAMYFAFLGTYTMALVPPALIGIFSVVYHSMYLQVRITLLGVLPCKMKLSFLTRTRTQRKWWPVALQVFFSIFNIVWTTFFLEVWKRNSATYAYKWGTIGTDDFEEARPAYHGELGVNKVADFLLIIEMTEAPPTQKSTFQHF